jgi:hypothetical protein
MAASSVSRYGLTLYAMPGLKVSVRSHGHRRLRYEGRLEFVIYYQYGFYPPAPSRLRWRNAEPLKRQNQVLAQPRYALLVLVDRRAVLAPAYIAASLLILRTQ